MNVSAETRERLRRRLHDAIWQQANERVLAGEAFILTACDICGLPVMDDDEVSRSSPGDPGGEGTFHRACAFPGSA